MSNYQRVGGSWRKALRTQSHPRQSCRSPRLERGGSRGNGIGASRSLRGAAADLLLDREGERMSTKIDFQRVLPVSGIIVLAKAWMPTAGIWLSWQLEGGLGCQVRRGTSRRSAVTPLLLWESCQASAGGDLFFLAGNFSPCCHTESQNHRITE